ncbi:hypothetical protein GH714_007456 [Hevea brasiliensis]|uniref:Dihydrolipoamide acetyltransferase component of pyruvate dehydrogenase complex n=1 Tax=Hevea brasiliensis TaxID=3981 RepID=A0A6A6KAA1_HEVBR|nr:hypothetical protein GH714_007456 [Hevea brasiliensis]
MMLGVLRRRVTTGSSSSSILRQSLQSIRPAASTPRVCSLPEKEILLHPTPRGFGHVCYFSHLISPGRSVSSGLMRDSVDVVVPFMGESITDGTLAKFLKNPGDRVEVDEPIAQIETDKVTIDVASPEAGVIKEFVAKEGETVEPGTKVAVISKSGEDYPHPVSICVKVMLFLKGIPFWFKVFILLGQSSASMELDKNRSYLGLIIRAFVEKHGVKLGLMSGFVKAAVSGLQNQPIINAVIDGDDIIYRDYVDVSIAVGTPKGLVVPVIRNADKMNFAEIEKEINTLAKKANDGTISIDEMAGGSFTISNGGVYGSLLSTPIINPPQSAILGMHSIVTRPMVIGGNIVPRPMMYIALTQVLEELFLTGAPWFMKFYL